MTTPETFQLVDLHDSGTALSVQWRSAPGPHVRPIDAALLERIGTQVTALVTPSWMAQHETCERTVGSGRR